MHDSSSADRCAAILLALLRRRADHRLSEAEQRSRRDEVNEILSEMSDEAITQALSAIYRFAEAEARARSRDLSRAIHEPHELSWLELLRRKFAFARFGRR